MGKHREEPTGIARAEARLPGPEKEIDAYGYCTFCQSWLPWKMLAGPLGETRCVDRAKCKRASTSGEPRRAVRSAKPKANERTES